MEKSRVSNKKNKTLSKTLSPKSLPNLPISPTFNIQPLPIFPPFFKNQTEPTKKKHTPDGTFPGFSTWTPRTPSFVFVKSKSLNFDVSEVKSFVKASRWLGSHCLVGWESGGRDGKVFFFRPSQGEWGDFFRGFFGVFKGDFLEFHYRVFFWASQQKTNDCFLWASQTKMVEVRHGDIKGKVPKTPNSGTTNIPILSLEVWEWYGKLMGREFNYWGSLEKSRNETIKEKTCQFRSRKCKKK